MATVQEALDHLQDMTRQRDRAERRVQEAHIGLRCTIWAGQTTGDEVVDHVLMNFGPDFPDKTQCERYRKVNEAIAGKTGQLVIGWHLGLGTRGSWRVQVGVLTGDKLIFVRSDSIAAMPLMACFLPTDSHVSLYQTAEDEFAHIINRPLGEQYGRLTMDATDLLGYPERPQKPLYVRVGDNEALTFFRELQRTRAWKDEVMEGIFAKLGRSELLELL